MNPKSLLIPLAAFAVAVTGVQAFSSDILLRAGLNDEQIAAFEVAKELRAEGDREAARDILIEAGIDEKTMHAIREAMHSERSGMHEAMKVTLEAGDFAAFKVAVEGSPIADLITSEADFALFKEAHEHKEAANAIMVELGFPEHGGPMGGHKARHLGSFGLGKSE